MVSVFRGVLASGMRGLFRSRVGIDDRVRTCPDFFSSSGHSLYRERHDDLPQASTGEGNARSELKDCVAWGVPAKDVDVHP